MKKRAPAISSQHVLDQLSPSQRAALAGQEEEVVQVFADLMVRAHTVVGVSTFARESWLAYIISRLPQESALLEQLQRMKVEDLTLAWACSRGDPSAIAIVEEQCLDIVDIVVPSIPNAAEHLDEIKQQLRQRLFVRTADKQPRITLYNGQCDLRGWIRISAINCAIDLLRRYRRETPLDEAMLAVLPTTDGNIELDYLKQRYSAEFKSAFEEAMTTLTDRERNILGYYYLEHLKVEEIATIYGTHRTTVSRWLSRTRQQLMEETRDRLQVRLRLEEGEYESIIRLIHSQLDFSIERYLKQ